MPSIVVEDLGRPDSTFIHLGLMSNLDVLINQMEDMVAVMEGRDEEAKEGDKSNDTWKQATGQFNVVLGGFQSFLTGLFVEQSKLERETDELRHKQDALEKEREDLIERSHELHCRIQYNALEMKLDQSFRSTERCSSIDSAKCFRDEAEENLRRTNEMVRVGNLRKCQLDREIFNQMEYVTNQFQKYESEREDYVKEIELFNDVRRKKISNWLTEPRSEEERELGESIIEFLDLSSRRRFLEPKIIGNALRMHSFNESLAFDRQDNLRRMEEMVSLQQQVDSMSGVNNIPLRKTPATTDLVGEAHPAPLVANDDDAYSDYLDSQSHPAPSGVILHRCPKKLNLVTDPITEPHLLHQLETALRWEAVDGLSVPTTNFDPPTEGASTTASVELPNIDPSSTPRQLSCADSVMEEEAEEGDNNDDGGVGIQEKEEEEKEKDYGNKVRHESRETDPVKKCDCVESVTSVCGDAASQASKCSQKEAEGGGIRVQTINVPPPPLPLPKSSHLLLHQIESGTGVKGHGTAQEELIACLVKRKSSAGIHNSMTSIHTVTEKAESTTGVNGAANANTAHANTSRCENKISAEDRETRSLGQAGRSGISGNSNIRASRDHL